MTTTTTSLTVTQALALPLETLQAMDVQMLQDVHSVLASSPQKKATRKADLVTGIIKGLKKATSDVVETVQAELLPVENSVKTPSKKRPGKAKVKPEPKEEEILEVDGTEPKAETTVPKKKAPGKKAPSKALKEQIKEADEEVKEEEPKKPKSLKKKKAPKPDMKKMSQEELIEYAKTLQEATEDFPSIIPGEKASYTRLDMDTIEDIQKHLLEKPMHLYVYVDEKLDESLTQFLVVFVNAEVLVMIDRNRQVNTTVTVPQKDLDSEYMTFSKAKFKYSFYERSPRK